VQVKACEVVACQALNEQETATQGLSLVQGMNDREKIYLPPVVLYLILHCEQQIA